MDEAEITPEQAKVICERVREMLAYLHKLRTRMEQRGFPVDDPLRLQVSEAHDAVHKLRAMLHYLSCPSGTGKSRGSGQ